MNQPKKYIGKLTNDAMMSCSRLPALMGLSGFSTPNDELKKSLRAVGCKFSDDKDFVTNQAIHFGNLYEGPILADGARRLGLEIDMEVTEAATCSDLPLAGSLDAILYGDGRTITTDPEKGIYCYNAESVTLEGPGVGEAKLTSDFPADEPRPYRGPIQCQGLQLCTEYKWHVIFTLFRGVELRIFVGAGDPAMQEKIRADVLDFQTRVDLYKRDGVTDWYPALSSNDASKTYNKSEDDLPDLILGGDVNVAAKELIAAKAEKAALEKKIDALQTQIMDYMGLHPVAVVTDGDRKVARITWGMTPPRKEYIVKASPASRAKSLRVKEIKIG